MTACRSFIVFTDEADSKGVMRTWRMSPEFRDQAEAEQYLEYVRTGWPQAYLRSFESDVRLVPQTVAEQSRPWMWN